MDGYTTRTIHTFDPEPDSDDDDPDELPATVKYSVILQEEDDFLDED